MTELLAALSLGTDLGMCLTVSLAVDGAGLGTAFGERTARQLLAAAGFGEITVHDAPGDPGNAVFVTHKPEQPPAARTRP
jgi:hypothetical protein